MALEVVKTLLRFRSISNYAVKFPTCSTRIELIDVKKLQVLQHQNIRKTVDKFIDSLP